jgi:hypothetical protein
MKRTAGLLVLVALAASCGGGGASSTGASSGAREDPTKALTTYLAAMKPIHDDLRRRDDDLDGALQRARRDDPDTLDSAARVFEDTSSAYYEDVMTEAAIVPPKGLEEAHRAHLRAVRRMSGVLNDMKNDLSLHDLHAISHWKSSVLSQVDLARKDLLAWKSGVIGYARRYGVDLPEWVYHVGMGDSARTA